MCYSRRMVLPSGSTPARALAAGAIALLASVSSASAALPPPGSAPSASSVAATASASASAAPAGTAAPPVARDAAGPERSAVPRPAPAASAACSFAVPVCVHPSPATPAWAARSVLTSAEAALSGYRALGLPMPLPDGARGGTAAWDVYILPPDVYTSVTVADPESEPRHFDEAAAFTLLPEPSTWGCDLGFEVARRAAEAVLLRLDAAAERGVLAASASYLASIVAPCAAVETPAIDAFQAEPHRAVSAERAGAAHGGLLFPMYLEEQSGSGDPGRLVTSLFAIASQRTDPASPSWQNEPDVFDALRSSMRFRRGSLEDLLLDFAVARAFAGDRSDGMHLPASDLHGAAGRVFFEWSVPYASLPRRLAPARPLEPTGATYLWLDLAGAPADAEITFVADWELPAVMRWSLVKVAKDGAEAGRVDVAGIFGATHAERTLLLREELAGVIVAGTFTGSLDRSSPFDPDDAPFLPHAYEVTLYGPLPAAPGP